MVKYLLLFVGAITILAVAIFTYSSAKPVTNPNTEVPSKKQTFSSQEYGFTVIIPEGWTYKDKQEKAGNSILVVTLENEDGRISIPIFIETKSWDLAISDVKKNFKPEAIQEITLAGQPAVKIVSKDKEINPAYNYRIKHSKRTDTVLLGVAFYNSYQQGEKKELESLEEFHKTVESVLNSITFN